MHRWKSSCHNQVRKVPKLWALSDIQQAHLIKSYGFESVIRGILIRKWKKMTRIQAQKTKDPGGTSLILGYPFYFHICAVYPEPGSPSSFPSIWPVHASPVCLEGCHGRPGHEAFPFTSHSQSFHQRWKLDNSNICILLCLEMASTRICPITSHECLIGCSFS